MNTTIQVVLCLGGLLAAVEFLQAVVERRREAEEETAFDDMPVRQPERTSETPDRPIQKVDERPEGESAAETRVMVANRPEAPASVSASGSHALLQTGLVQAPRRPKPSRAQPSGHLRCSRSPSR